MQRVTALNATAACVLGILRMGPPPPALREPGPEAMTGWQIHQTAQQSLARFWNITRSQIYLELGRLEDQHLVEAVGAGGPRASRPFRITDRGVDAFQHWLDAWVAAGPQDDQLRSPLVLTVFFGSFVPADALDSLLREYELRHRRLLQSRRTLLDGLGPEARRSLPAATLERGIAVHELTLTWLRRTLRAATGSRPSGSR
jgi:DNA-binding PadR family transcriptional regulator